jgi:hypothetical protein
VSRQAPLRLEELPQTEQDPYDARAASRRARRIAASRVRRRRLLVIDLSIAAALALFGLIVAPGLAILALFALLVLLGCAGWIVTERVRARRSARPRGRRAAGRSAPRR